MIDNFFQLPQHPIAGVLPTYRPNKDDSIAAHMKKIVAVNFTFEM